MEIDEVIIGCIEKKPKAQNELYKMFYNSLLLVSLKYTDNKHEAEDIVHDCFIKIFNDFYTFYGKTKSELSSWMCTIVRNKTIDFYRKNKKNSGLDVSDYMIEDEIYDEDCLYESLTPYLPKLIETLSPQYKKVVTLYYMENKSHEEISKILNISVGSSKSNLFKSKANIKKTLLALQLIN